MPATATVTVPDAELCLKDYLIFRVDYLDGHRELSDDSALEAEAVRYAELMAATDAERGIHYEVRSAETAGLLFTTEGARNPGRKEDPWLQPTQMAML